MAGADAEQGASAVRTGPGLLERARAAAADGDHGAVVAHLRDLTHIDRSYRVWSGAARLLCRVSDELRGDGRAELRVALVGTSTLDQLGELLPLAGLGADLALDVRVSGIGRYETELLDPSSELYAAEPDIVILAPDARSVVFPPHTSDPDAAVSDEVARWTSVWSAVQRSSGARVLQFNFVPPCFRPLGGLEARDPGGRRSLFLELNRRLAAAAGPDVHIVDVFGVALDVGLDAFNDDRYWFRSKQAFWLGALPAIAAEIATGVRAALGRSRKCLVVDLDNTLWGGVVGDDGAESLVLSGDPAGEAYLLLQQYVRDLRQRGVLLAVCSKNDEAAAREPFTRRDDMVLTLDDFAAFRANWLPKPENLRSLAEELSLGLDSFVFLDDNPAERDFVRWELPEVDVIELPDDPAGFPAAVAGYRGFDVAQLVAEDLERTDQYRARSAAARLADGAASVEEFLASLEMIAVVRPVDELTIDRVTQLVNKTNQWNLTTRRHTADRIRQLATSADAVTLTVTLHDRFADHGLVAVLIAEQQDSVLSIDTFLMSCRVIGRQLEHAVIDQLVSVAAERGVTTIEGTYRRTPKNGSVAEVYGALGFELIEESDEGSRWRYDLSSGTMPGNRFIEVRSEGGQ